VSKCPQQSRINPSTAGEWLTADEVAAWFKVSKHHVYKKIAKMPGCEPINVGRSSQQPSYRFNRYQLIAALSAQSAQQRR